MIFTRIAASAAVALGLLAAVPGAALASTAPASTALASPAGSGPRPVLVRCAPKAVKRGGPVTGLGCCAAKAVKKPVKKHSGVPVVVAACCPATVVTSHGGKVTNVKVASCCPNAIISKRGATTVVRAACCAQLIVIRSAPGHTVKPIPIATPVPVRAAACAAQPMTFDMPAYSSTATEVSGPRLTAHEVVIYKQHAFMIRSVHGHSFTLAELPTLVRQQVKPGKKPVAVQVKLHVKPFTNGATAITDGHAVVLGGLVAIAVWIKRVP